MRKNIKNVYEDIRLWKGSVIRKYKSLDLMSELDVETQIISVQKSTIEILDWILERIWVKENDNISVKTALWRSWFTKIRSRDYWTIWILATKWADSTKSFSRISDYCLLWTDIWNKVNSRWLNLLELSTILWETLWGYKTELLLLLWLETLDRVKKRFLNIWNFELDIVTTKFTPILTKKAIEKLEWVYKKPLIDEVDSNSELNIQILEYLNSDLLIWWVEIVQSGISLIATNNAIVSNWKIIMPSVRNTKSWEFEGEVLAEVEPDSQIWIIANAIQSPINVSLYENMVNQNNKPKEFISVILDKMGRV